MPLKIALFGGCRESIGVRLRPSGRYFPIVFPVHRAMPSLLKTVRMPEAFTKRGVCIFWLLLLCYAPQAASQAQDRCGYDQLMQGRRVWYPEGAEQFERWLSKKMNENQPEALTAQSEVPVYTIPVVVHVIHNGEPVGTRSNLSQRLITRQIETLTEDFRRKNADASLTAPEFLAVGADCKIEFVLARQDPYGLPTSGITRTKQSPTQPLDQKHDVASIALWPVADYLNFWTIDKNAMGTAYEGLQGVSQFPISERAVFGLSSDTTLFNGIAVRRDKVGTQPNNDSAGRTATHEVGHFLGLRHVWGDGGCDRDDFCEDTPLAEAPADACTPKDSCGSRDMVENYMDYTPDACMNLFTNCQKERMRTVLAHDPIRRKLLTSKAKEPVPITQHDAGIRRIISPQTSECHDSFTPQIEVANYGTNILREVVVAMSVDGEEKERKTLAGPLLSYDFVSLSFGAYEMGETPPPYLSFSFEIVSVMGKADVHTANNTKTVQVMRHPPFRVDDTEGFEVMPRQWLTTPDSLERARVVSSTRTGQNVLKFSFATSSQGEYGREYGIRSPIIDMSRYVNTDLVLNFRYSYAGRDSSDDLVTGLRVVVHERCNGSKRKREIFNKYGDTLVTSAANIQGKTPAESDWREATLLLSSFGDTPFVQLELLARNGKANDLYVDALTVSRKEVHAYDVGIEAVYTAYTACGLKGKHHVTLRNYGKETQEAALFLTVAIDGVSEFATEEIAPTTRWQNATTWISFSTASKNLRDGEHVLEVAIGSDDGLLDDYEENNTASATFYLHQKRDHLPTLENFEPYQKEGVRWYAPTNAQGGAWEFAAHKNKGQRASNRVAHAAAYDRAAAYRLMSPVYDFSNASAVTMSFEVAYAKRGTLHDALQLLASEDCGNTFEHMLYAKGGDTLAIKDTFRKWAPEHADDWRQETVDLSILAGKRNIQLAFVMQSAGGNDLYLDDIEIFDRASSEKIASQKDKVLLHPNPAQGLVHLSFHLLEKAKVSLRLYDIAGRRIKEQTYDDTLNQIYSMDLPQKSRVYILQVTKEAQVLRSFRVLSE